MQYTVASTAPSVKMSNHAVPPPESPPIVPTDPPIAQHIQPVERQHHHGHHHKTSSSSPSASQTLPPRAEPSQPPAYVEAETAATHTHPACPTCRQNPDEYISLNDFRKMMRLTRLQTTIPITGA